MNKKTILVSGCSFTFEHWCWPTFTTNELETNLINVGLASQGNGLISKKLIYNVDKFLKSNSNEDLVVGVMWSGIDRHDFHIDEEIKLANIDGWLENPTKIIDDKNLNSSWLIVNHHWKTPQSKIWYENYHTDIGALIFTIQNIVFTQMYLEKNKVKYFMTTFMDIFKPFNHLLNHPEIKYLYDLIDFDKFVQIDGCHEWVKENYGNNGGFNLPDNKGYQGYHPTEFGHKRFANEVIVPYIKEKKLL
jgi:hypothetical protein